MNSKRMKITITVLLLLFVLAAVIYWIFIVNSRDTVPPVIKIDSKVLTVSVSAKEQDLLKGVTAKDKTDGDVTAKIIIENISNINDNKEAVITYAAFDDSGNVSKADRTLIYSDYKPPRFYVKKSLVLTEEIEQDVLGFVGAKDTIDGDISNRVKGNLISNTISLSYVGTHKVEFRVTNSMGDTSKIVLPVHVFPASEFNSTLELSDYLIYIPKGSAFNAEKYLKRLTSGSLKYALDGSDPNVGLMINSSRDSNAPNTANVKISSNVNTAVPGVYTVTYNAAVNGNHKGFALLNVVVEG